MLRDQHGDRYDDFVIATETDTRSRRQIDDARIVRRALLSRSDRHVEAAAELLRTMPGPTPLRDLRDRLGLGGDGFSAIVCCMLDGLARRADEGPLGPDSILVAERA